MPSTNRTPNLGLNSWIDSDRPKRIDFVSDNTIIDNYVGGHIADTDVHLTAAEKARATEPFRIMVLYGTGETSMSVNVGFNPAMVTVFRTGYPLGYYNGTSFNVDSAVWTPRGASCGISVEGERVTLLNGSTGITRVTNNLNEENAQYILIAYR